MNKNAMDVKVSKIAENEPELVTIFCHRIDHRVQDIVDFVKSRQGQVAGCLDGNEYEIPISKVYYIESVDNRCFLYCEDRVYETKQRLYELEQFLTAKRFLRVSKSVLLNLMKVESIKPAMNGRFLALLKNGEKIIISRKYVPVLKETLREGK